MDGRRIFSHTLALQGAQVFTIAVSFVTFSLITKSLSPSHYGVWAMLLALANYLFVATASWNNQGYVRFGREEFSTHHRIAETATSRLILLTAATVVSFLPLILFKDKLFGFIGVDPAFIWFIVAFLLLQVVLDWLLATMQVTGSFGLIALLQALDKATYLGAIFTVLYLDRGLTVKFLAIALVLSKTVTLALMLGRMPWGAFSHLRPSVGNLAAFWRYSAPFLVSSIFGHVTIVMEPYVINFFLDPSEVAKYSVAYQLYTFYQALTITVFTMFLLPFFTDLVTHGRKDILRRVAGRFMGQLVVLNIVILSIVTPGILMCFPWVFPHYTDSIRILILLLSCTSWQIILSTFSAMLGAHKVTKPLAAANACSGFLFVGLYYLLIPTWGIISLAVVWAGWYALVTPVYMFYLRKHGQIGEINQLAPAIIGSTSVILVLLFSDTKYLAASLSLATIPVILLIARRRRWFGIEDLTALSYIKLPEAMMNMITGFYGWMDTGGVDGKGGKGVRTGIGCSYPPKQ